MLEGVVHRINASAAALLKTEGLTLEQWRVLERLARHGEAPMTELAAAVLTPAPTVTRIVDKLVSRALVYRSSAMNDRRRVLVHASSRGEDLHARLAPAVREAHASVFEGLTPEQRQEFSRLLSIILDGSG
jgi:DNA-binding MarR family transcriptional regulator